MTAAETAVADGEGLVGTGFWSAVGLIKKEPDLVERYGDRVSEIDQAAFKNWALLTVPITIGNILTLVATVVGIGAVVMSVVLEGTPAILAMLVGLAILLVTTHGLAHLVVGQMVGIRFTYWFIGTIGRPQPGVKVEYSSYLRTSATSRAWMHASGAIMTKATPLLLIAPSRIADLPVWVTWGLVVVSFLSILTDVLWSTSSSDWKKFRRELAFAQES